MNSDDQSEKVFVVRIADGSGSHDYVLLDVYREEFFGINCLAGTYHTRSKNIYIADKLMRIPCERVISIVEFDSIEDYRATIENYYAAKAIE